ncbi:hypothetical protein [Reyranella soli]|uniref:Uncharacterized protein n=1 Tax=Reyranella soli TaxID=1230389 RepID=A0A512N8P3_9HYPH|nr:hypothetical protein [Reyranella soli]GEP55359.1 hypothetical protein RSO01_25250 [Reyranella soli]
MSSNFEQRAKDMPRVDKRGRKPGPWGSKPWRDAVSRAAHRRDPATGLRYLEMAAAALVRRAVEGDDAALKELGDRLDGRVSGNAGEGQARVSFVVHMPAPLQPDAWARSAGVNHAAVGSVAPCHTMVEAQRTDFGDDVGDGEGESERFTRS